jgi:hypothetical protein
MAIDKNDKLFSDKTQITKVLCTAPRDLALELAARDNNAIEVQNAQVISQIDLLDGEGKESVGL